MFFLLAELRNIIPLELVFEYLNVSDVCLMFNGGGHIRAAGGFISLPFEEAKARVIDECKKNLK